MYRAHLNFRGSALTPIIERTTLANIAPGLSRRPAACALSLLWRASSVAKRPRRLFRACRGGTAL
jgi:hypothetical protein